jgi:purine-nucleoside phosphorylase
MRHRSSELSAQVAAAFLRKKLGFTTASLPVGLVLGTGWGDVLTFEQDRIVDFKEIPGFAALEPLEGHARQVVRGRLGMRDVVALRGRIHLNERPADPSLYAMARLQIEMLIQLGVKTIILTCAAGSLSPRVMVGEVMLIDGFVTVFAPDMPLFAGEFCSPEDAIDQETIASVMRNAPNHVPIIVKTGAYAMLRGPFFEGRKHDKRFLASSGASAVGMSVLPETCIAALYPEVKILPMAFITNTASEDHSHEENLRRSKTAATHLGALLKLIVDVS